MADHLPLEYEQVMRDDVALDTLARRGDVSHLADDEAVRLLARWVADIDAVRERRSVTGQPLARRSPPRRPDRRWRHGGVVAVAVAAAVVGSSGVAAAVTGDPVAPLRAAVALVSGSLGGGQPGDAADDTVSPAPPLPTRAATSAQVAAGLRRGAALVAHGNLDGARALLAAAQEQLAAAGEAAPPGLSRRLAALAATIERAEQQASADGGAQPGTGHGNGHRSQPGADRPDDAGSSSTPNLGHGAGGGQGAAADAQAKGADAHGKASSRP